jgi:hypothetical protein
MVEGGSLSFTVEEGLEGGDDDDERSRGDCFGSAHGERPDDDDESVQISVFFLRD